MPAPVVYALSSTVRTLSDGIPPHKKEAVEVLKGEDVRNNSSRAFFAPVSHIPYDPVSFLIWLGRELNHRRAMSEGARPRMELGIPRYFLFPLWRCNAAIFILF